MTTMTLNQTPTEQVISKAASESTITDARGRSILLKKPPVLQQFRLIEALEDAAKNEVYVRMVMPLLYVAEINGEACIPLDTKSVVEALIQQLDEDGIAAVMEGVNKHYGAKKPAENKAALKK